jgi:hypothetical protein
MPGRRRKPSQRSVFLRLFLRKKEVLSLIQNPLQNVSGTDTVTKAEAPVSVK